LSEAKPIKAAREEGDGFREGSTHPTQSAFESLPQAPGGVARDAKRKRKIIFAQDVPTLAGSYPELCIVGNIPSVVLEAPN
jgi:hypothetical protein